MREMTFEEVQQVGYDILRKIDEICRKFDIVYYIAYGTLLGAVRHKGFIPWDDDVDIWVPIEQYERFLNVMETESGYQVLSFLENKAIFPQCWSKITDPRTRIIEDESNGRGLGGGLPRGVGVDIFPLYGCQMSKYWRYKHVFLYEMATKSFVYRLRGGVKSVA